MEELYINPNFIDKPTSNPLPSDETHPAPIDIDRPPRLQHELPIGQQDIPKPPTQDEEGYARLIQISLPLLTIFGYVAISTLGGVGRNPLFMIPMALSMVASVGFSIYSFFKEKQRRAEVEKVFADEITALHKTMEEAHDKQRRFYHYNYPAGEELFEIVRLAESEAKSQDERLRRVNRLWERRFSDDDFGHIRLGIGEQASSVTYHLSEAEDIYNPLVREALNLQKASQFVDNIPITLALRPLPQTDANSEPSPLAGRTPVSHALGIAGQKQEVHQLVRAMLGHYAVFHAPADAKLYVLASTAGRKEWGWTDTLPHAQGDEQGVFRCFVGLPEAPEFDQAQPNRGGEEEDLETFLERLRKTLAQRRLKHQAEARDEQAGLAPHPFLLVVVDLLDTSTEAEAPLNIGAVEADAALSILLDEGDRLGAAVIFLVPERSQIPSRCTAVIEVQSGEVSTRSSLIFRYIETGISPPTYLGQADQVATHALSRRKKQIDPLQQLARQLAMFKIRESAGAELGANVPFMELMRQQDLTGLRRQVKQNWQNSVALNQADWLQVPLGLMAGNKPRTLRFSADQDGVHGMVAGSTGSGKSELLISLIIGLATSYSPEMLNFILVDFKGAAAFEGLDELPHCVDLITNLSQDNVARMFTAIEAELTRRQTLLKGVAKNIVDYRRDAQYANREPLPFLFIIIDEFAEMINSRPEYRTQLEKITRIGRSLGVSLILAAQNPSGVTDQMRSNIKFRICLRVESETESREMLRRSDAAYLTVPGRGYLQVGNEEIELIQIAYTGEEYRGHDYCRYAPDQKPPVLYQAIIHELADLANRTNIKPQHAPWPTFLPKKFHLNDPLFLPIKQQDDEELKPITEPDIYFEKKAIVHLQLGVEWPKKPGQNPNDEWPADLSLNPAVKLWLEPEGVKAWPGHTLDWRKYALKPVIGLIDDPYAALHVPLTANLPDGHVVLFSRSEDGKLIFIRNLVLSMTATHAPNQLHLYLLGGRSLTVFSGFPHVGAVINPDTEGYEEQVEQMLRKLTDLVNERKKVLGTKWDNLLAYNDTNPQASLPAVVVVINNFVEFTETFGTENDNIESVLDRFVGLARQAKEYGIHLVITANQLGDLSNKVYSLFTERLTLKLADPAEHRAIAGHGAGDISDLPGRGYVNSEGRALAFQLAHPVNTAENGATNRGEAEQESDGLKAIGERMMRQAASKRPGYIRPIAIGALPDRVFYRAMLAKAQGIHQDESFWQDLKQVTQDAWERPPAEHDWLQVSLGISAGNQPRALTFHANKDGVHGLIAGGTGSGKSELLMTMIVGLALNYSPKMLNFVLVDYKGGGAFDPFKTLPHCVEYVTNLNPTAVDRMFKQIWAEVERRQKLNTETGYDTIVDYHKNWDTHQRPDPYPHLVIIIDEYAEMIEDNPDYKRELEKITRVGRSLGVHLFLAAQRPKGVTDQMRANMSLRICLRVEQTDSSRELLRRPDAAFLPRKAGRGYLQVGNEPLELLQVAYTGEEQPDASQLSSELTPSSKFLEVVVALCRLLWVDKPVPKPWPDFLPKWLSLESRLYDRKNNHDLILNRAVSDWLNGEATGDWAKDNGSHSTLRPLIGLLDNPATAEQTPLALDLRRNHLALFGEAGSGKTTFLQSLIISLVTDHSPQELHLYIIDLGGQNFDNFKALPHVGDVISDDEHFEERLNRLLTRLNHWERQRQQWIGSNFEAYNQSCRQNNRIDQVLPAIVVIIDNIAELHENYDEQEKTLTMLMRRSLSAGITMVTTGNSPNNMLGKLYNLFGERLTFRQTTSDQYRDIVGAGAIDLADIPGRGYYKAKPPLIFQTALPIGHSEASAVSLSRAVHRLAKVMNERAGETARPEPIGFLAESIPLNALLTQGATSRVSRIQAMVGQSFELQPVLLDLSRWSHHLAVIGPPQSGRTTALHSLIFSLAYRYRPEQLQLVLMDPRRRLFDYDGTTSLAELPHVAATIAEAHELEQLLPNLQTAGKQLAAQSTSREIYIIIDNYDEFSQILGGNSSPLLQELAQLAQSYGQHGLHVIIAGLAGAKGNDLLKNQVMAATFGLALRSQKAVQTFDATRSLPELRSGDLPAGRGYLFQAGKLTLLQVATPYPELSPTSLVEPEEEEVIRAAALDKWVKRIRKPYKGQTFDKYLVSTAASPTIAPDRLLILARYHRYVAEIGRWMRAHISPEADQAAVIEIFNKLVRQDLDDFLVQKMEMDLKELFIQIKYPNGSNSAVLEQQVAQMDADTLCRELDKVLANGKHP